MRQLPWREKVACVIHKNLSVERQAAEVLAVKQAMTGIIPNPVTIEPGQTIASAIQLMKLHNISGVPVVRK